MYLLDTNILSELVKKQPAKGFISKLGSVEADQLFTSSITVAELRMGAALRSNKTLFWKKIEEQILSRIQILPVDHLAALFAGDILALLKQHGIPIGLADALIGSIALSKNMTMVTANVRHFERIPKLRIENWLALTD